MMIFITSAPKSGTHLLAKIVDELLGGYPVSVKEKKALKSFDYGSYAQHRALVGHFRFAHLETNPSLRALVFGRKLFVLIRDPRDICVSMVYYLEQSVNPMHVAAARQLAGLDLKDKIKKTALGFEVLAGQFRIADLAQHCGGFLEMVEHAPEACLLRYEDFFDAGLAAGKIADFLSIDKNLVSACINNAFSTALRTKRDGVPYSWRKTFDDELQHFFNDHFGSIISRLGYPLCQPSASPGTT